MATTENDYGDDEIFYGSARCVALPESTVYTPPSSAVPVLSTNFYFIFMALHLFS